MTGEKQGTKSSPTPATGRKSDSDKASGERPTPGPLKSEDSTGINPEKERPIDSKMPHLLQTEMV